MNDRATSGRTTLRHTLRALGRLLSYPDAGLRALLPGLRDVLDVEGIVRGERLAALHRLLDVLGAGDALEIEAAYVECFDRGRRTSLHLFEHVHGDSRDRGPAMIDLGQTYARAGLHLAPGELPDYLPVVLEFASTQPDAEARSFLGEMAHILNALHTALQARRSPYAAVVAALVEIAGAQLEAVPLKAEEALDASWAEPAAFDGCSSLGQSRPGQPQPVRFVRRHQQGAAQ